MKLETPDVYATVQLPGACSSGALAHDEDLVCKARVRICLYERFPRFRRFVLILRQPSHGEATSWAAGFRD